MPVFARSDAARSSSDLVSDTTSSVLAGVSKGVSAAQGAAQELLESVSSATSGLQTAASGTQSSFAASFGGTAEGVKASTASAISALLLTVTSSSFSTYTLRRSSLLCCVCLQALCQSLCVTRYQQLAMQHDLQRSKLPPSLLQRRSRRQYLQPAPSWPPSCSGRGGLVATAA